MAFRNLASAQAEFQKLRDREALTRVETARLVEEAVRACLSPSGDLDAAVELLCELATLDDPELAALGTDGIFRQAIESMADAFEPRLCERYRRFFARVLQYCRRLPSAAPIDRRLRDFGLWSEQDLAARAERLRHPRRAAGPVRKILVLSRVTLGADVAITSVVLRRMMRAFPEARVVFLAGEKAELLFAGEKQIAVHRVAYPRGGGLVERLGAWLPVVEAIEQELQGLDAGEYLVLDPDSRLTQLGMLPVVRDEAAYHLFESRSFSRPPAGALSELTAAWLAEAFGPYPGPLHPWVSLPKKTTRFAQAVRAAWPAARWVSVNLGVGDNPAKRIEGGFEQRLVTALLNSGWRILLDKGEGPEETARVEQLLAPVQAADWRVAQIEEDSGLPDRRAHVVAWRGSLAGFGALIGVSDLYIGYDSACQHVAAALGVKTIDIFAGFRSPRMVERWRPSGPAEVRMVVVDPHCPVEPEKILAAVLEAAR